MSKSCWLLLFTIEHRKHSTFRLSAFFGGSRGAAAPDGALIHCVASQIKMQAFFACLGSLFARTLRVLAPRSETKQTNKKYPLGIFLGLVGREGLEPPTSSV